VYDIFQITELGDLRFRYRYFYLYFTVMDFVFFEFCLTVLRFRTILSVSDFPKHPDLVPDLDLVPDPDLDLN
jgi:hypothetical protein